MAKVEIIGPKNQFFDVLALLHEQGTLHIEDLTKKIQTGEVPLDRMEVYEKQDLERERMEEMLIRVRAIIKALHRPDAELDPTKRHQEYDRLWKLEGDELSAEIASIMADVEDRTSSLASAHTSLESELSLLARYEPILHKIQPLAKQIVTTGAFDSVALLVERRYKGALDQLKEELDKLTKKQCEIVSTDVDEDTTAAIVVFAKAYSEPVHKFLAMENVNQIRLPSEFQDMPFDAAYDAIQQRRKSLPTERDEISKELAAMSEKWYLRLATVRDVLIDKLDEIAAIPKFGRTSYAFVINGWIPVEELPQLRRMLHERWGDEIIVDQREIDEHEFDVTPVAMKNPKYIAPFQTLLGMYGMPKYGTIDPTLFLFVFYPLFFGMIVGDIGYGLVMMAIVLWLRYSKRDNPGIQLGTAILGPAATMVIVFGFVYGEFFGNVFTKYWQIIKPVAILGVTFPFHRIALMQQFMLIAIALGAVQVMIGLVIGVINGVRTKHKKHVWEKGGMLAVLAGIGLVILTSIKAFSLAVGTTGASAFQAVAALIMLIGFFYAIRGGSAMGAIESILQLSNIASYIRIMAVGLAGAIFADAVNQIMEKTGNVGFALIVGILLHGLNFVIAAFSPTIHALRLNFVEFFGKFYETGKEMYKPFHKTGGEKNA